MDAQISFNKGDLITADQAMQLAIEVAKRGAPFVSPNPVVGCVVVDNNHRFLDIGYHPKFGHEHAEINALNKLNSEELTGSTFYVTLEPCAHQGKTGSCAKKLATLPIKKVVYGIEDPNPLVQGKGAAILLAANIEVQEYSGLHKAEVHELVEIFVKNFSQHKVFVAAKVASSLDGQIALKNGESKWITSEISRKYVHELRSYYDAILIGSNTVTQDDPSLNIRHPQIEKKNRLIILDAENELFKKQFKFMKIHEHQNIYFAVTKKNSDNPFQQLEISDVNDLLSQIFDLGMRSVFIEGGAKVYSSFIQSGLVDRLYVFMAPTIIGAGDGLSWTSQVTIKSLTQKITLRDLKVRTLGPDIFMTARVNDKIL